MCKRVDQQIECKECGYPFSEAKFFLFYNNWEGRMLAVNPVSGDIIPDPGHYPETTGNDK